MTIQLTTVETEQFFLNALCNSLSQVPAWWGCVLNYDQKEYKEAAKKLTEPSFEDVLMQLLRDGGELKVVDVEGEGENNSTIKLQDVYDRISLTPVDHLVAMYNEEDDGNTADAILQSVFFKEIIFG